LSSYSSFASRPRVWVSRTAGDRVRKKEGRKRKRREKKRKEVEERKRAGSTKVWGCVSIRCASTPPVPKKRGGGNGKAAGTSPKTPPHQQLSIVDRLHRPAKEGGGGERGGRGKRAITKDFYVSSSLAFSPTTARIEREKKGSRPYSGSVSC